MGSSEAQDVASERIGRYAIFDEIARGGMARVHLARLLGPEGFSRVVAVKRLHPELLAEHEFQRMFVAESRLAARVRHPNVVPLLDVLISGGELMIVMEYVHGESLHALHSLVRAARAAIPRSIASAIVVAVLQGLHAAHEARDERGEALDIVHRDVSPQNVLVGADGVARVLDFGVAKAVQAHESQPESLKGKFSYMAPEIVRGATATRRSDVFSASVVLWELLTGRKLFRGRTDRERMFAVLRGNYPRPSHFDASIEAALDAVVMRGLSPEPDERYASALEMAIELERAAPLASQRLVGEWVTSFAATTLERRTALIARIETSPGAAAPQLITPTNFSAPAAREETADSAEFALAVRRRFPAIGGSRKWMLGAALALGAVLVITVGRSIRAGSESSHAAGPEPGSSANLAPQARLAAPQARPAAIADATRASQMGTVAPSPAASVEPARALPKVPAVSRKPQVRPKDFMPHEL